MRRTLKNNRRSYPTYRMNTDNKVVPVENSNAQNYFGADLLKLPPSDTGVYRKPLYYGLSHVIAGFLSFHYSWLGIVFLVYQLSQLILNKRFFFFQGRMEDGNSIGHTAFKLGEFLIGMLIAFVVHKIYPKFKLPQDRFSD